MAVKPSRWEIQLLGGLQATQGERTVGRFRTRKAGALLAYLAYHRDRPHSRELLVELLWPGSDPTEGRMRLSTELTSLRRLLAPEDQPDFPVLLADRAAVQLNPDLFAVDVEKFEEMLETAQIGRGPEAGEQLARAVELYQGELLPGYCEDWIFPERQRLAGLYLRAMGQLITHLERAGEHHQALQRAWEAVKADPLEEEGYRHLIRLLAASGQPAGALRQFEHLSRRLAEALGAAPEFEIGELAGTIPRLQGAGADPAHSAQDLAWRGQAAVAEAQSLRQQLAEQMADNRELRQQLAVERAERRELRQQLVRANQQLRAAEATGRRPHPRPPRRPR